MSHLWVKNGKVETLTDYQEKQRRLKKPTTGQIEDAFNQMGADMERVFATLCARLDALEQHVGFVPPIPPPADVAVEKVENP